MKNKKDIAFMVGAVLVLAGALLGVMRLSPAVYVLGAGAAVLFVLRFAFAQRSPDFRVRRMERMRFFASLFMLGATYYLYKGNGAWVILLLIAALFEGVAAFRSPKDEN